MSRDALAFTAPRADADADGAGAHGAGAAGADAPVADAAVGDAAVGDAASPAASSPAAASGCVSRRRCLLFGADAADSAAMPNPRMPNASPRVSSFSWTIFSSLLALSQQTGCGHARSIRVSETSSICTMSRPASTASRNTWLHIRKPGPDGKCNAHRLYAATLSSRCAMAG